MKAHEQLREAFVKVIPPGLTALKSPEAMAPADPVDRMRHVLWLLADMDKYQYPASFYQWQIGFIEGYLWTLGVVA